MEEKVIIDREGLENPQTKKIKETKRPRGGREGEREKKKQHKVSQII